MLNGCQTTALMGATAGILPFMMAHSPVRSLFLLLVGLLVACQTAASNPETAVPTPLTGPALLFFYTDG